MKWSSVEYHRTIVHLLVPVTSCKILSKASWEFAKLPSSIHRMHGDAVLVTRALPASYYNFQINWNYQGSFFFAKKKIPLVIVLALLLALSALSKKARSKAREITRGIFFRKEKRPLKKTFDLKIVVKIWNKITRWIRLRNSATQEYSSIRWKEWKVIHTNCQALSSWMIKALLCAPKIDKFWRWNIGLQQRRAARLN